MEFINGQSRRQVMLLPDCIDDYISAENPVRVIDAYVNGLDLEKIGCACYQPAETGRPPYNPKDLLKLYVYGYMNRVRSSRRLENESVRNVEVMWLLGSLRPDHKTIAEFRRKNTVALKNVFGDFVRVCVKAGLYGKELLAIDGSKFKAVNSKDRNYTGGKLKDRVKRIDRKIEEYLKELEESDREENVAEKGKTAEEIQGILRELEGRKETYQNYRREMEESGETQKSLTDEDSRLMPANGKMDVCYNVQTAVDAKNCLITAFEVTNDANDKNHLTEMAEKGREAIGAERIGAVADTGYDSVQDIVRGMDEGIAVHVAGTDYDICVEEESGGAEGKEITAHKNGRCVYNGERNISVCPMGKVLYPVFYKEAKGTGVYANREACLACTCRCTAEKRGKRHDVPMEKERWSKQYNDKGLRVKQIRVAPDAELIKQRKAIVEHPFGTIKRQMDAGYCMTRGKYKVGGEFALVFLAYNMKRAINILGTEELMKILAP